MERSRRIMCRYLLALVMGTVLVMSQAGLGAQAKVTDAVGQDPTDVYDDGRGADLQAAQTPSSYVIGFNLAVAGLLKLHQQK